jgi:hypothetical protein
MMPDITLDGMKAIVTWLGSFVTWRQTQGREKDAQITTALTSLMDAALETRHYMALVRETPQMKNPDKERDLAKLWAKAGIDMSYIDSALAGRYLMKAEYWSDTQGWTDAQKNDGLIQLDEVLRLGQQVLLA